MVQSFCVVVRVTTGVRARGPITRIQDIDFSRKIKGDLEMEKYA